jgi:hypothetical protein
MTRREQHDPEWHLSHPSTRKWMVQCAGCRRWGYRHDAPPKFFGEPHMVEHFEQLKLTDTGLCGQCSAAVSRQL